MLTPREQIRGIPREKVQSVKPQAVLLMPERLLNGLNWEEIMDLLGFLDGLGNSP